MQRVEESEKIFVELHQVVHERLDGIEVFVLDSLVEEGLLSRSVFPHGHLAELAVDEVERGARAALFVKIRKVPDQRVHYVQVVRGQ
uniref:Uncharacterized protein n=1 Tax=Lymantria dispar multicapsid nuclear polyhedrosis virus TaxID=10449 RepID=A0A6H0F118_NPVLD|nr:hypothetical protein [Lymantria dispar multiple nucleopolyhedrovirus]